MWVDCKSSEERADRKQTHIPQLKGKLHLIKHPRRDWNCGCTEKKKKRENTTLIVSPSLQWNNQVVFRREQRIFFVKNFGIFGGFFELLSGSDKETARW